MRQREENAPRTRRAVSYSDELTAPIESVRVGDLIKQRYEVLEHIGCGGMADVFRGWDELFCRDVAIKVLKRERISDAMCKRVLREARACCAVDHPHMVRVTDIGVVHDAPFLVMDLLRGVSLAEMLRRSPEGRLEWRQAISLLLPVMEALHLAHEAGVVHRDLKPENLFLHRRGDTDVLMVLDLGLVKFTDADGTAGPRWTQTGLILGTAAYMSPEQANSGAIDRRSDVYSLGVTLYRVLTGQHLFTCATGDGPIVAMTCHLYEAPPRLGPTFPPALVTAVAAALVKDPAGRHASMDVFARALRACLDGAPRGGGAGRWQRVSPSIGRIGQVGIGAILALAVQQVVAPDAAGVASASPADVAADGAHDDDVLDLCVPPLPSPLGGADEPDACEFVHEGDVAAGPENSAARRSRRSASVGAQPVEPPVASPDPFPGAAGEIRRCVRDHGDPDAEALTVRVTLRADGGVAAAGIRGEDAASFLTRCVRERLLRLRFESGPTSREHTYHFNRGALP